MRTVVVVVVAVVVIGFAIDAMCRRFRQLSEHKLRLLRSRDYPGGRLCIYLQPRDLWVGSYLDPRYLYVCPLPTVVVRWQWEPADADPLDAAMFYVWLHGKWRWITSQMTTEAREAAVAAVMRYDRSLKDDEPIDRASLAWWEG